MTEVVMPWRISSYCESNGCVEISVVRPDLNAAPTTGKLEFGKDHTTGEWLLRNSNNPDAVLRYTDEEWVAFLKGVENRDFEK